MSDDRAPARLAKWPFYLADLLLCAVIFFVLNQLGPFEGTTDMLIVIACLITAAIAAWFSLLPWLKEHHASIQLSDSSNLKSSLEQIRNVEKVADLIRQSNSQWQGVQDASARTLASAREITDKMKLEADEFVKFISNAHDQERAGLRLEVEKLRRMEGDWIKVAVQMLDHVFALARAAERSGQQQLIKQLQQFQNACRDVARRMGLTPFVPVIGDVFDHRAHQLPNPQMTAQEGDLIKDVLASGFSYQGQMLRRSLVLLDSSAANAETSAAEPEAITTPNGVGPSSITAVEESISPSIPEAQSGTDEASEHVTREDVTGESAVPTISQAPNPPMFKDAADEPPIFKDSLENEQNILQQEEESAVVEHAASSVIAAAEQPSRTETQRPSRRVKRQGQDELPL
jgi:molecular chaperone GrpE (heat shock protein)